MAGLVGLAEGSAVFLFKAYSTGCGQQAVLRSQAMTEPAGHNPDKSGDLPLRREGGSPLWPRITGGMSFLALAVMLLEKLDSFNGAVDGLGKLAGFFKDMPPWVLWGLLAAYKCRFSHPPPPAVQNVKFGPSISGKLGHPSGRPALTGRS